MSRVECTHEEENGDKCIYICSLYTDMGNYMVDQYKISIFNKVRGRRDTYRLILNSQGWYVSFIMINGQSDSKGNPFLYKNFNHDRLSYPVELPDIMEYLWKMRFHKKVAKRQVEPKLSTISNWLSKVNETKPRIDMKPSRKGIGAFCTYYEGR